MESRIFTKEEKAQLDFTALELFERNSTGEKTFPLYQYVKEKTDILLYYLPRKKHFLSEEYATEFYLAQRKRIDNIIYDYYAVSHISYMTYIANYCRLRAFSFEVRHREKAKIDAAVMGDSELAKLEFYLPEYFMDVEIQKEEEIILEFDKPSSLKTAVNNIVHANKAIIKDMSIVEEKLAITLEHKRNRAEVVYLILNVYTSLDMEVQRKFSRLFQTDIHYFASLSALMEDFQEKQDRSLSNNRDRVISKHWVRYLTLCKAKFLEIEEVKIKEIEWQQKNCITWMRKLQRKSEKEHHGMSLREIASELDIPLSRVFNGVKNAKSLFLSLFIE